MSSLMDDMEISGEYPSEGVNSPVKVVISVKGDNAATEGFSSLSTLEESLPNNFNVCHDHYKQYGVPPIEDKEEHLAGHGNHEVVGPSGPSQFQAVKETASTITRNDARYDSFGKSYANLQNYADEYIPEAPNNDEEYAPVNPRSVSPPSSQGSLSSIEFLDSATEHMAKKTQDLRERMNSGELDFSKKEYDLLNVWMKDQSFINRIRLGFIYDFNSYTTLNGKKQEDPETCKSLQKALETQDFSLLLARLGKIHIENQFGNCKTNSPITSSSTNFTEEDKVSESNIYNFVSTAVVNTQSSSLEQNTGVVAIYKNNVTPNCSHQNANSGALVEVDIGLTSAEEVRSESENVRLNSLILKAYGHIGKNPSSRSKQIIKAGQVLFNGVFSVEEIAQCTLSGKAKKTPRGRRRPFPEEKVDFIHQMVGWLLTNPSTKTIHAFEKTIITNKCWLSDDDYCCLKKVFTEYAYSRRHAQEETTEVKTEGEGSPESKRQKFQ